MGNDKVVHTDPDLPDLNFVPGDKAVSYLRSMSQVNSSFGESVGYMARDMVSSFTAGATLREFVDEAVQSIKEHTSGDYQKVELFAVNDLVNGVLRAESLIGKEDSYDFSGVRNKSADLGLKADSRDASSDVSVSLDFSDVGKKMDRDNRTM